MHNIVVIGGNYAGAGISHYLLRHVIPLLNSTTNTSEHFKITVVSLTDHTYFTIGAPRVLCSPESAPVEKLFASVGETYAKYKSSEFTFIHGEATRVNEDEKTVSVRNIGTADSTTVPYDVLILATGTTANAPWTQNGDRASTIAVFEDLRKRIAKAKSIIIAGGGPTGIESTGEIAYFYPGKDITLLSGSTRLLGRLKNANAPKDAEKKLAKLKVKTVHNLRVVDVTKTDNDTKTALTFSDGSTRAVDLYIDATGGKVNSGFIPTAWLDTSTNKVVTDGETLRAKNAPAGVYAIGDVSSFSNSNAIDATWAVPALAYSIWADIKTGKISSLSNGDAKGGSSAIGPDLSAMKEKKYKQMQSDMIVVPIGPKGGVGVMFGWRVPNWLVWLLKARTFAIDRAPVYANGLSTP